MVSGSLECAEGSEPEFASCFGSGKYSSAVYLVFQCFCWSVGIAFDAHHSSLLLHSCKWDNLVPICITLVLVLLYWGLADLDPGGLIFIGSLGFVAVTVLLVGGIGQSFLSSKRLPDIFPASGQGVLVQTGASSNGGGCFLMLKASDFQNLLGP